jgi:alpha-1,2-mannosyltransferase
MPLLVCEQACRFEYFDMNAPAFLPSSFAMYMNMFAFSYALDPPSFKNNRRTMMAILCFAIGAIVGWPFALALAGPFVFEELFVYGVDRVPPETRLPWFLKRWKRLFGAGMVASLVFVNNIFYTNK